MTTNFRQRFADFLNTIDTAHHEYYTNAVGDFLDWLEAPPVQVLEGTRLTVARHRRGLSQSELAAWIGVAEKTLRAWEEKKEWCEDKEIILKLAWALKFPVGFFTGPEIELLDPKRVSFRR